MQNILINIHTSNIKLHKYYIESFERLKIEKNVVTFVFTEKINIEDKNINKKLEEKGIILIEYTNKEDFLRKITNINKNNNIVYINAFNEKLITLANEAKKFISQEITKNFNLFTNKEIQRNLLLKYNNNITVNYLEDKLEELNFKKLKEEFGTPFIIKPKNGIESSGVAKIRDENELEEYKRQNTNENILVEEFIDGEMYSLDYFVDEKGNIKSSGVVKVELGNKIGINDFFNLSRIISEEVNKEVDKNKLYIFIKESIKATGIKNTFVHHEFKLTSKGELKTIELNGRIGGYRLEMYQQAYLLNLLEIPFDKEKSESRDLKNNIAVLSIYPKEEGVLKTYNYELLEKIKKLDSFSSLRILPEKYEGKKIGLTKNGYSKVGGIKLKNKDKNSFKKDYDFIEKNYIDLLILK